MAGSFRRFPAAKFRNKITFVMNMGAPPEIARQAAFHFAEIVSYVGTSDGDDVPFDPTVPVTRTVRPPMIVPCVVEFAPASEVVTSFGTVIPDRVKITLLDVHYEQVKDARFVIVNGDRYDKQFEPPAIGLFDVGVHEMYFVAEQER